MTTELQLVTPPAPNRTGFVGGSDVAAILGLSPWKTAYQLWEEKVGLSEPDDTANVEAKRWGKRLEPAVMEMIQDEWDIAIRDRNVIHVHPEYPWAHAEVDFDWVAEDGSIANGEVKTSHWRKAHEWGTPWSDEIPPYYACQNLWGQFCSRRSKTLDAVLLGVGELRPYVIEWNDEIGNWIVENVTRFWEHNVLKRIPPPLTTTADAARVISRFEGLTILTTDDIDEDVRRIRGLREAIKRLEAVQARHELHIQLRMATATDGITEPGRFAVLDQAGKPIVRWNIVKRRGYTVQPTEYRTFTIAR